MDQIHLLRKRCHQLSHSTHVQSYISECQKGYMAAAGKPDWILSSVECLKILENDLSFVRKNICRIFVAIISL